MKKIVEDLKDFSHVGKTEWQFANLHRGLDSTLNIASNELKYKASVVKQYGLLPAVECLPLELNQVFMNLLINAGQAIAQAGRITISTGVRGLSLTVQVPRRPTSAETLPYRDGPVVTGSFVAMQPDLLKGRKYTALI